MERLLELQSPITIVLQQSPDDQVRATNKRQLTPQEWDLVRRLVKLLRPLYDATSILSSNSYPTLSLVHLVWSSTILDLNEEIKQDGQPQMISDVAQVIFILSVELIVLF